MKASVLKRDKRFEIRADKSLNIQTFGDSNDYPQQVIEIVDASVTGKSCLGVYAKFISGRGFVDDVFYKMVVNSHGQTSDYILDQISKDFAQFGGFALHLNFNANFQITEIYHQPFEHVRFEKLSDNNEFDRVAVHPDWGKRFTSLRKWKKDDIEFIHLFQPDPEKIQEQVDAAGGWQNYKGQIFYYSSAGEKTYPLPIFDAVLTDMNSEEGVSNVNNRNVRNNFLAAGMLVDKVNSDDTDEQESATEKALIEFQGDEEACKIMYIQVESDEEVPEFIPFKGNNYDKEFTVTNKTVEEKIGKAFNQPPILRAENVGANFGADLMKNAYDYYNSVTENERLAIERVLSQIFKYWHDQTPADFSVIPLSYQVKMTLAERLGEKGMESLMKIIENASLTQENKRNLLKRLFDLNEDELNDLTPIAI